MTDFKVMLTLIITNVLSLLIYYPIVNALQNTTFLYFASCFTITFILTSVVFYKVYSRIIRFIMPKIKETDKNKLHYVVVSSLSFVIMVTAYLLSLFSDGGFAIYLIIFMASFKGILMSLSTMDLFSLLEDI